MDDATCASHFIDVFGRRAYRRPLAADEKAAYAALYADYAAGGYDDALRVVVETMLQSPNFLYHVELAPPASTAGVLPLDPFELASRLSFFLAATAPDDALLDAAAQGTLADRRGLRAQAERLLSAPSATDALASFHLQWLELEQARRAHEGPRRVSRASTRRWRRDAGRDDALRRLRLPQGRRQARDAAHRAVLVPRGAALRPLRRRARRGRGPVAPVDARPEASARAC